MMHSDRQASSESHSYAFGTTGVERKHSGVPNANPTVVQSDELRLALQASSESTFEDTRDAFGSTGVER